MWPCTPDVLTQDGTSKRIAVLTTLAWCYIAVHNEHYARAVD